MRALRIIHVANRAEKKHGERFYSLPYKMQNGFVRNGHNVIWFSDRDVARAASILPAQKLGKWSCNARLLKLCRNVRPDVIVLAHADLISNETLLEIKKLLPQVMLFQYDIDLLHPHTIKRIQHRAGLFSATFMTTAGAVLSGLGSANSPVGFFPNPVDSSIDVHQNFNREHLDTDVFFAGTPSSILDKDDIRNKIGNLANEGEGWRVRAFQQLWGADYLDALALAKVGLNFSVGLENVVEGEGGPHYLYSSDRISQYAGNGLLTISNSRFQLRELYGESLLEVDSYEGLRDTLRSMLRDDRQWRVAASNLHRLVHAEFNEVLVTRYMLETVLGEKHSHPYQWPVRMWS